MNKFWRLPFERDEVNEKMFSDSCLIAPVELFAKIKPGHGIVLSKWDNNVLVGNVLALGIVQSVNVGEATAEMAWTQSDVTLKPNPQGRQFWRNKPFFRFADTVSVRYMLDDLFSDQFRDIEGIPLDKVTRTRVEKDVQGHTYQVIPGYIYVIKSEYGYKIGKTISIKSRTRLFSVKLPFPIELIHYAWFDNYSKAERDFHDRFSSKRLEGEWFDLSPSDIDEIKKYGKLVPVEGL
ncbi:GIY-YIG nuclease family protein [Anaerolineales bacterium HSG24]|nr:GIY-YIG nuclease family protein [Anaerolineales bacterium HSG24]